MKDHTETIERYLLGEMDEAERSAFEEAVKLDKELEEALLLQEDLLVGITSHFDDALRAKLKAADAQISTGEAKIVALGTKAIWKWAAAAAVALALVGVFYFMNQGSKSDRLFALYYQDFPNIIDLPQRDVVTSSQEAFILYQSQRWEEAFQAFDARTGDPGASAYTDFYQGICLLNLNEFEQALVKFDQARQEGDPRFSSPATWYTALTYLRLGDLDHAAQVLENIAASPGAYRDDALRLLSEMR